MYFLRAVCAQLRPHTNTPNSCCIDDFTFSPSCLFAWRIRQILINLQVKSSECQVFSVTSVRCRIGAGVCVPPFGATVRCARQFKDPHETTNMPCERLYKPNWNADIYFVETFSKN